MPKNMYGKEVSGERAHADFYPTADNIAEAQIRLTVCGSLTFDISHLAPRILDPAAGDGVYGRVARKLMPNAYIVGIEPRAEAKIEPAYDKIIRADFLTWDNDSEYFDFAMTNPPYERNHEDVKVRNLVGKFWRRSLDLLKPLGNVSMFLRNGFMHGTTRYHDEFAPGRGGRPRRIYALVRRPDFTGQGGFNHDQVIVIAPKGGALITTFDWLLLDKELPQGVTRKGKGKKGNDEQPDESL